MPKILISKAFSFLYFIVLSLTNGTTYQELNMAKAHISPANNTANISNANKGTSGQNLQRCQNQGNRGWQMNPQNPANKGNNSSKKR